MRIAMVSPYDLSVPGGVQGQVLGLTRALRGAGHDVVVVAPGNPSASESGLVLVGRSVGLRANGSVAPVALSPLAVVRAAHVVGAKDIDVVHLHEPFAPVINYGCLLTGRHRVVATFHRNGKSALYGALGPLLRALARGFAATCAVSEAARDNIASFAGPDVQVLFNGVELDRFGGVDPAPHSAPTVLFVGRHEPRKGLAVLLEAFDKMRRPAQLWVVGDGPATAELKRAHPPSAELHWLGAVSDDEKVTLLSGADVFCAPSLLGESFGVVLLEAMAARCAVVASDIDGYRGAAGGHARLVAAGDAPGLATALDEALVDAAAGRGLSSPGALGAAERHAQGWSMDRLAERYANIYERVLDDRRPGANPLDR